MYEKKLQKFFKIVFLNGQAKDFQLDKKVVKVFWKSRSFFSKSSVYFRSYFLVAQEKMSVALRFQLCL